LLLSVALLLFQLPSFDPASCPKLYWRVSYNGPCKTREDLDEILAQHKQWIESKGVNGKPANFRGAILSGDDLGNVDLWGADLKGTVLNGANLAGAVLGPTRQGEQQSKIAPGAFAIGAPMFFSAEVGGVTYGFRPHPTDLSHSLAYKVVFRDADLSHTDLEFSRFPDSDLSDADLTGANLSHASLVGTNLNHANFTDVDLFEAVLEPTSVSGLVGVESAKHLETVTFEKSPSGLIQLRKLLRDQGFLEQPRKLTYAINRQQADLDSSTERWFKKVAFDLTCQYGMSPGRCLRLVLLLWVVFSVLFYIAIHKRGWMLLRVTRRQGYSEKTRQLCMWHTPDLRSGGLRRCIARLRFEFRVVRASIFFSLVNAFSIGYKEFSIGQWLLLLSKRQYEIRPSKWARTLAGVQSLLTVYLFALWLLTYFGQPFG
jgi:uncharacterized protein YjbI with pentapeptide repeats